MNDLPQGWMLSTLGQLCAPSQYGWTTSAAPDRNSGLRFLRTTDITKGVIDWNKVPYCAEEPPEPERYRLSPGDIVVSRAGSVGFSAYLDRVEPSVFASYLIRFRPSSKMNGQYLGWFLKSPSYWSQIEAAASGITLANVNAKKLSAVAVPLAPRREQERIVAAIEEHLSRLDAGVRALERAKRSLTKMRASVLDGAVSGKLTSDTSDSWNRPPLSSLGTLDRGKSRHRPRNDPKLYDGPYPFIQTGDVAAASPWIESYSQTYNEVGLEQSRLWPRGTLCITIAANIARTGLLTFDACFPDSVVGFIAEDGPDATRWVELVVRHMQNRLEQLAPATAQKNINLAVLRSLEIPYPEASTQQRILNEFDRQMSLIDGLAKATGGMGVRTSALQSSILVSAFSGKLVPRDPSDEPASVLLDLIAAERASAPRPTSARKPRTPSRRKIQA
jgi:type I restriction enzyme, S subunit